MARGRGRPRGWRWAPPPPGALGLLVLAAAWTLSLGGVLERERRPLSPSSPPGRASDLSPAAPLTVRLGTAADVYAFLASDEFRASYWERFPVLIKTEQAFAGVLSLERDVLGPEAAFRYLGNKQEPPYHNVRFLARNFYRRSERHAPGEVVGAAEIRDALDGSHTVQMLGAQGWWPSVAGLCHNLSVATGLTTNVNVYVTPAGLPTSLKPHSDFTCNFMVHLAGHKRWRLWKQPDFWLPVDERFIVGRDEDEQITAAELGAPLLDIVLEPGDVLYVPRGCFHATSTTDEDGKALQGVSMHLTTQAAVMYDKGMSYTWQAFLGGDFRMENSHLQPSLRAAFQSAVEHDARLRESIPLQWLGPEGALTPETRQHAKALLHAVVDEMVDRTDFLEKTRRDMAAAVQTFRDALRLAPASPPHQQHHQQEKETPAGPAVAPAPLPDWTAFEPASACHECGGCRPARVTLEVPYLASLYPTPKPAAYRLEARCVAGEKSCRKIAKRLQAASAAAASGSAPPTKTVRAVNAVVLSIFRRPFLLAQMLQMVRAQTVPVDLYILNNNQDNTARCEFETILNSELTAMGSDRGALRSVWMFHSPYNLRQGHHAFAAGIRAAYDYIVFNDDDSAMAPTVVDALMREARQFTTSLMCAWALNFENYGNYWDRTMPEVHHLAKYCGGAQFVAPSALFDDLGALMGYLPDEFRVVSDLWLNAYAIVARGMTLRRSSVAVHSSLDASGTVALSTAEGMRPLKTKMLHYMSERLRWPFVGPTRSYDEEKQAARQLAGSDLRDAALAFDRLVRNWPHYSEAWNDRGVTYLRCAVTGVGPKEQRLVTGLHSLRTALQLPLHRSVEVATKNLALVQAELDTLGLAPSDSDLGGYCDAHGTCDLGR